MTSREFRLVRSLGGRAVAGDRVDRLPRQAGLDPASAMSGFSLEQLLGKRIIGVNADRWVTLVLENGVVLDFAPDEEFALRSARQPRIQLWYQGRPYTGFASSRSRRVQENPAEVLAEVIEKLQELQRHSDVGYTVEGYVDAARHATMAALSHYRLREEGRKLGGRKCDS